MRFAKRFFSLIFAFTASLGLSNVCDAFTQTEINDLGQHLSFETGVLSNFTLKPRIYVRLINHSATVIPAGKGEWRIYLHSTFPIELASPTGLVIHHVQGDLHEISSEKEFAGLPVGETLGLIFESVGPLVVYSDFFPRTFIAQNGLTPVVIANTDTEEVKSFVGNFSSLEQRLRNAHDKYLTTTAESRYQANQLLLNGELTKNSFRITPTPKQVEVLGGDFVFDNTWAISADKNFANEANYLSNELNQLGFKIHPQNTAAKKNILFKKNKTNKNTEAYRLLLDGDKIEITAPDSAGAFYAAETLLDLFAVDSKTQSTLPKLKIEDEPRYLWRGMHYDFARNFHGKDAIKRLITQMAHYKLNRLHLHLSDDEGWRLEIKSLPELTAISGQRCFDLSEKKCLLTQLGSGPSLSGSGQGYLTEKDFVEIIKYASERHIEVIPEVDMPGHARAAIKAMEARFDRLATAGKNVEAVQYLLSDPLDKSHYASVQNYSDNAINPCLESSYRFIDAVISALKKDYQQAGVELKIFHMGGDEVGKGAWTESPACQKFFADSNSSVKQVKDLKPYFLKRVDAIVSAKGLSLAGWSDGVMLDGNQIAERNSFKVPHFYINAWDDVWEGGAPDKAYRQANADYQVILSSATHLYFDHPQSVNADARGRYWATRVTSAEKVFNFMPDKFYANADKTSSGEPINDLQAFVGRPLAQLNKPKNILGMQGQIWSEVLRTRDQVEEMLYPRLICLAERAWHKADWESDSTNIEKSNIEKRFADWQSFNQHLGEKELPRLSMQKINFYLEPPGARLKINQLLANTAILGEQLEISFNEGKNWIQFQSPYILAADQNNFWLRGRIGFVVSVPVKFSVIDSHLVDITHTN